MAGVPCRLHIVPGAYHGFDDIEPEVEISRTFRNIKSAELYEALLDGKR